MFHKSVCIPEMFAFFYNKSNQRPKIQYKTNSWISIYFLHTIRHLCHHLIDMEVVNDEFIYS